MVQNIERDEIEFISRTLGCQPVASLDHFTSDKLGHAELVQDEVVSFFGYNGDSRGAGVSVTVLYRDGCLVFFFAQVPGGGHIVRITGVNAKNTVTVLLRASNNLVRLYKDR